MAEEQVASSNNGAESGESETAEDLKVELERREKVLRATVEERDTLMSELEELDRQNQEATQVSASLCYCVFFLTFTCSSKRLDIKRITTYLQHV